MVIAGGADLLVTNDMADFTPGPRAAVDAHVVSREPRGRPVAFRVLLRLNENNDAGEG
jgi:hypothetical protein